MAAESRAGRDKRSPQVILASGLVVIAIVFLGQFSSIYSKSSITVGAAELASYDRAAPITFAVVTAGIAMALYGIYRLQLSWRQIENPKSAVERVELGVANALRNQRKIFWLSLAAYSAFFAFGSGIAVFSSQNFAERYGIDSTPSYHIMGCCGQPGAYPVLTVYVTQNFGFLFVPSNLVLIAFLPFLVALNVSMLSFRTKYRPFGRLSPASMGKELSACGASAGMLAGCPTCAASIIFALAGSGGALGISAAVLASLQPVFVLASFASLFAAPVISESRLPIRSYLRL